MRETERIADQLKRAHEGGAWHGPAIDELLAGMTAGQAAARPSAGAHSVWELAAHVEAWERAVLRRLGGDPAAIYNTEEDWSSVADAPEEVWQAVKTKLAETYAALREAVLQLDDAQLDEPILPGMSTRYVSLHGAIQHTLYHAGQIALVKRALGQTPPPVTVDTISADTTSI
jgi:uncharacterized damage-inducible protein DinB